MKSKIKNAKKMLGKVRELEAKGQTFVSFADVCAFELVCRTVGTVACGGAFANDMSGQWFYI